jgi:recombinational DNA repair ATPase RecF
MSDIQPRIIDRLIDSGHADEPWALIVLAALEGEQQLEAFLDRPTPKDTPQRIEPTSEETAEPPGVYVGSITVEGFRGVGPAASLPLRPGPGLTLVVGRNGSGKSSFAEGLEYLLTGRNYRWEKRNKAWVGGWRNLHHDHVALRADLLVEGSGTIAVSRTWKGDDLAANELKAIGPNKKPLPFAKIGWDEALVTFRPFLSYNELGSLLEEGPSKLYDALSTVLGLEELVAVQTRLASARKTRQSIADDAADGAAEIQALLDGVEPGSGFDRIETARKALKTPKWDLAALKKLTTVGESPEASHIDLLRRLESLERLDEDGVARAIAALRAAAGAIADLAGTDAERSRQRADILAKALAFHESHQDDDCPVCGSGGALSGAWAAEARTQIQQLQQEAAACQAADAGVKAAMREAQRYLAPPPPLLAQAKDTGVAGLAELRRLWQEWASGRDVESAAALATHMESRALELAEAIHTVTASAEAERKRLEDVWAPIAAAIAAWLPTARKALTSKDVIKQIKSAEEWWKETSAAVRDERFAPIATRARAVWSQLRLQSNVDLGGVVLEGVAQRRRVALQVTVDGTPADALGVMSQGELHSLALSLFLPRATLPESPFRFICIDDPVQSMDPSRVDGLARALAEAALTRQVIVFTHDDRLPSAVRRLGLPATIHTVTRRAKSVVEVRQTADPVSTLLDDARAIALTDDLPEEVASRVVPGFCRAAVEAACMERVRRRRLLRGDTHEEVEELLAAHAKMYPLIALALFNDESKTNDVMPRLRKAGSWAVEAFEICRMGAHERHEGELKVLIDDSRRLARFVSEAP